MKNFNNKTVPVNSDGRFKVGESVFYKDGNSKAKILHIIKNIKAKTPETTYQYKIDFKGNLFFINRNNIRKLRKDEKFPEITGRFEVGQRVYFQTLYEQFTVISLEYGWHNEIIYKLEDDNGKSIKTYDNSIRLIRRDTIDPKFKPNDIVVDKRYGGNAAYRAGVYDAPAKYKVLNTFTYDDNYDYNYNSVEILNESIGVTKIFVTLESIFKLFKEPLIIFSEEDPLVRKIGMKIKI